MSDGSTYQLTVVVVNYNVEHFLDQCLHSVKRAIQNMSVEVIIVDNASVDGSLHMLEQKYPEFTLIANKDNVGFSKANNQAMRIAKGKYVLLLNPDTVVAEDTFEKAFEFAEANPNSGGIGVHMIDGKGQFLPESKRGLPTPMVAFYKIFGLSSVFPKSKRFGQYHAGHISENETAKIDVLSGAFMWMRKETLDKVGLLDEDYFMYGEDIDLSYRITKGGYDNYYFPGTSIIHYKGESTKKSSVNYVLIFYRAMIIFAKKHFSDKNAWLVSFLINTAIYLRAFLAIVSRFLKQFFLPLVDFIYICGGGYLLTNYWKMSNIEFPQDLISYSIPAYTIMWIGATYFNGGYDYPIKLFKYLKGVIFATIIILVAYAILPKQYQFSRLFIFLGASWALCYYFISRVFLHLAIGKKFKLFQKQKGRFSIVSGKVEFDRIRQLLSKTHVGLNEVKHSDKNQSPEANPEEEIVFSSKDIDYGDIIRFMIDLKGQSPEFKIAPPESDVLIGSNSIDTAGDLYMVNLNALKSIENRRKKRFFDFCFSVGLLISVPITTFFVDRKSTYLSNLFSILIGKRTFIGYSDTEMKTDVRLPKTKIGILSPSDAIEGADSGIREKLNLLYARDYSMRKDFSILLKSWRNLDR